jgi:hypothetical protein
MTDPSVRTIRRADELQVGDWLAATMSEDDFPTEVAALVPFSTAEKGPMIEITYRQPDGDLGHWPVLPEAVLTLATAAEVAEQQARAGRARVAAELVRLADLVLNHELPVTVAGNTPTVAFPLGRDVAAVERVASVLGRKVDRIGRNVSVWLSEPDELPVGVYWSAFEPKDAVPDPDPTGQLYSREVDDPTPVSGARGGELHHGAMTDGGLIDETEVVEARTELAGHFRDAKSRDRRTCVDPGEPEHDHAMCQDVVAEEREALLAAADTVPVPAEDATVRRLPESEGEAR